MRKLIQTLLLSCLGFVSLSQPQPAVIDSFKTRLANAATDEEKVEVAGQLSKILMNVNPVEADEYGLKMTELAEASRDRKLMVKALLMNGERYSYLAGRRDNTSKSINYYKQALDLARTNKLDELVVSSYLSLSEIHRLVLENEKALNYSNQAFSHAGLLKNDSLTARVQLELGSVYLAKSEKLLSLRSYFAALRLAEELKNQQLLRASYSKLAQFYSGIQDYDRAIDFMTKSMETLNHIFTGQSPYNKVQDLARIGELYASKKNYDMSMRYYERSIQVADSLKFEPLKVISYRSIINNYMQAGQPEKALKYYNEHPQLKEFLQRLNFGHFVDHSYAVIYTQLGDFDSAKLYFAKAAPFFEKEVNAANQYGYNYQQGLLYRKTGELEKSLQYFTVAKDIADKVGNLEMMMATTEILDTLYRQKGDFKQAIYYTTLTDKYKDSLDQLGKEKDLMQAEADDEQQRQERLAREKEEKKRKRHSIQYLGITIGIAGLFILLVMMGMFKVSEGTIKAIGFFVFLMFFEFLFLVFKKNIYSVTKGEPWKDLLFMIALAALLLPLHHWLEHRVIKYLTSHNRLTSAGLHIKNKLFRRTKTD